MGGNGSVATGLNVSAFSSTTAGTSTICVVHAGSLKLFFSYSFWVTTWFPLWPSPPLHFSGAVINVLTPMMGILCFPRTDSRWTYFLNHPFWLYLICLTIIYQTDNTRKTRAGLKLSKVCSWAGQAYVTNYPDKNKKKIGRRWYSASLKRIEIDWLWWHPNDQWHW